jgi:hypothetical protein
VLSSTAMRRAGAPTELHVYAKGPHGDGMSPAPPPEAFRRTRGWIAPRSDLESVQSAPFLRPSRIRGSIRR